MRGGWAGTDRNRRRLQPQSCYLQKATSRALESHWSHTAHTSQKPRGAAKTNTLLGSACVDYTASLWN